MALLGEMHFVAPSTGSWFSLPRGGGVAYAAQESWVQNDTIRNNILFGAPYDEERYKKGMLFERRSFLLANLSDSDLSVCLATRSGLV